MNIQMFYLIGINSTQKTTENITYLNLKTIYGKQLILSMKYKV